MDYTGNSCHLFASWSAFALPLRCLVTSLPPGQHLPCLCVALSSLCLWWVVYTARLVYIVAHARVEREEGYYTSGMTWSEKDRLWGRMDMRGKVTSMTRLEREHFRGGMEHIWESS